jgi:hypothetical protein
VEKFGVWLARHPAAVGVAFAFLTGVSAYQAFQAGISFAELRATISDHARAASDALGG